MPQKTVVTHASKSHSHPATKVCMQHSKQGRINSNNHHFASRLQQPSLCRQAHTQKQRKALARQPTGAKVCSAVTREIYRCMVHKGQLRYYVTNGRCVLMFAPLWMARFNPVLRSLHPVCQPAFQPGTRTT
jgi:hypothetical protein